MLIYIQRYLLIKLKIEKFIYLKNYNIVTKLTKN